MKTSKFLFALGAAVAVILPLQVQAGPDNEEQAKMRAALRQKMEELTAPKAGTPAAPAEPAPKPQPAPAAKTAPAPTPQPAPPPPAAAVVEPQTQVVPVPVPVPAPAPVAPAAAVTSQQPSANVPTRVPDAEAELMRAALRQKMAELKNTPTPATPVQSVASMPAVVAPPPSASTATVITPVAATSFTPIQPPPSPLSGSKEARLAELLARYKTDTITALEYHTQRAAILAEP